MISAPLPDPLFDSPANGQANAQTNGQTGDLAQAQSPLPKVKVTLLLDGGHQYTLFLERESILLKQLAWAMMARAQGKAGPELMQIPVEEGRASLCFSSRDLVGLVSDPPLVLQRSERSPEDSVANAAVGARTEIRPDKDVSILTALEQPLQPTREVVAGVLPSKYYLAENFLDPQEYEQLLNYVLQRESNFVPASTTTGDADYRQSLVLHQFPPFAAKFRSKIRQHLPELLPALDLEPFEASEIEAQLTAHNEGNYFKLHNDNGSPETATRVLTYVYYFYQQPKPFSGGELKIYDSRVENGYYVAADSACLIEPRNNSIIFFLSRYMHEVLPVSCPSQSFANSRFTVNGWVRR